MLFWELVDLGAIMVCTVGFIGCLAALIVDNVGDDK